MKQQTPLLSAASGYKAFEKALAMRYEVYCIECNFLSPGDYPDGVETDEHDEHAAHFYAFDDEEELVGYVRLVKPDPESRFPFQKHCDLSSGVELPNPGQAAEISRLMVRSDYRRRQSSGLSNATAQQNSAVFKVDRRHQAPAVLLNLYRQMYQHCLSHDIRFWYAAMEKPLSRSLARLGFSFVSIGPATDYYGPVAPYLADLRTLEAEVLQRDADLMDWLRGDAVKHHDAEAEPNTERVAGTASAAWTRPAPVANRHLAERSA